MPNSAEYGVVPLVMPTRTRDQDRQAMRVCAQHCKDAEDLRYLLTLLGLLTETRASARP